MYGKVGTMNGMKGKKHPMFGKKHSDETKKKMALTKLGKKMKFAYKRHGRSYIDGLNNKHACDLAIRRRWQKYRFNKANNSGGANEI